MVTDKQRSGSSRKSSSQARKDTRNSSSAPTPPSSSGQQQQMPRALLAGHFESNRHPRPIQSQSQHSRNHYASDTGFTVGSYNSKMGSVNDRYGDINDDYRIRDVQYSLQERQGHSINLLGPALPLGQRPTPEEQLRVYDDIIRGYQGHQGYQGYQHNAAVPSHYPYPQDIDLDCSEIPNSDPRGDLSGLNSSRSHGTSNCVITSQGVESRVTTVLPPSYLPAYQKLTNPAMIAGEKWKKEVQSGEAQSIDKSPSFPTPPTSKHHNSAYIRESVGSKLAPESPKLPTIGNVSSVFVSFSKFFRRHILL
ncbi:hypothetical protein LZ31DRAFT_281889 [Colletotrichum somersetense]|nr:hypothetical protein LZ31DRAFT_281889 [Colletotrichum somersetense]